MIYSVLVGNTTKFLRAAHRNAAIVRAWELFKVGDPAMIGAKVYADHMGHMIGDGSAYDRACNMQERRACVADQEPMHARTHAIPSSSDAENEARILAMMQ